jgi:hypothetical protein
MLHEGSIRYCQKTRRKIGCPQFGESPEHMDRNRTSGGVLGVNSPPVDGEVIEVEGCGAVHMRETINLEIANQNTGSPAESEIRIHGLVDGGFNAVKPHRVVSYIADAVP